ncbi:limonene-1,2-epoxide hydrolase family protein [Mycolicibacter senuensis]|uniref:limonene-1,2-epoxide hydrolase family protein n=1 Tax=Mycolicibacter senuensis TaxID=386913 RepID=UPI000DCDFA60|nr:limonene-1,2-epoxide hydrolase family protein [Mycolicibacter senuensis]RAV01570.1 hypothetical protein DQP56_07110 [Mycolicibacter senuensis]
MVKEDVTMNHAKPAQNSDDPHILALFQRWSISFEETCESFRALLGDSGVWIAGPEPIATAHGAEEAIALLEGFRASHGLATIEVEVLNLGRCGPFAYSERIDHLVNSHGDRFISLPVAGVMRLDDDNRVAYWRDYWDMREFLALPRHC